jgi:hypothetical protein
MNERPFAVLAVVLACASVGACAAGYESVDGYDAVYISGAPVGIEAYPRYRFRGGYVYDVHGRYYHQHGARWVRYRTLPREAVRDERAHR